MSDDAPTIHERVLVTGASGFIGSHLCRRLLRSGAEVHAISRRAVSDQGDIRWWQNDLSSSEDIEAVLAEVKPHLVFHLAAEVSGTRDLAAVTSMLQHNLVASVNLMVAATRQGCDRIVVAGSLEEPAADADVPVSPYAAAKGAAQAYARMLHRLYGTPVVNARLFMVYGPGQRDVKKLVPYSILSLLRREPPRIQSAERAVDWVYVDDVVEGLVACALAQGLAGSAVDVGSGELHTVREVVETICDLMQSDVKAAFGEGMPAHPERLRVADLGDSFARTGWRPKVSLRDGLHRTIEWYESSAGGGALPD